MISNHFLSEFEKRIQKEKISSCLIQSQGEKVFQYYKNNKMKDKLHKVNSVTKSVLSILVGIAIDRGDLVGVHQPISGFFHQHPLSEAQKEITIEHLLTMTPGFDWPEFSSWGGRAMPMINAKDWTRFIFAREMIESPGMAMYYNTGCSHLLSEILQKATGRSLVDYAEEYLFTPLEIQDFSWHATAKGIAIGGFGLSLRAEDMLKLGCLMLQKGRWRNQQLVSESWVKEPTIPRYHSYDKIGSYGYHWWILTDEAKQPTCPAAFFAMGYGGQYIITVPEHQLITTFTSDLYTAPFKPLQYFKEYIWCQAPLVDKS